MKLPARLRQGGSPSGSAGVPPPRPRRCAAIADRCNPGGIGRELPGDVDLGQPFDRIWRLLRRAAEVLDEQDSCVTRGVRVRLIISTMATIATTLSSRIANVRRMPRRTSQRTAARAGSEQQAGTKGRTAWRPSERDAEDHGRDDQDSDTRREHGGWGLDRAARRVDERR